MKISAFYTDVLGANLRNPRWSWGSYDPITNRVYLRVWKDELRRNNGSERILVLRGKPRRDSNGYSERRDQIEQIEKGASGFGVLCTAVDPATPGSRQIKSFDDKTLLQFGRTLREKSDVYLQVVRRIAVSELVRPRISETSLASDLRALMRLKIGRTEKEALVNARIG